MIELEKQQNSDIRGKRELELENEILRSLLDKANQALSCFINLRNLTGSELKSTHNGICILLEKTKMLDAIKAGVGKED